MRNAFKITVLVAFLAVPSVALATTAGSSSKPLAINCNSEQFKPKRITLACGDGGTWLSKLKWSSWTGSTATGAGTYNQNDCTPDCVMGKIKSYPVKVTLSKPKACSDQTSLGFKHAAFTWTGTRPNGASATWKFSCPPKLPGGY